MVPQQTRPRRRGAEIPRSTACRRTSATKAGTAPRPDGVREAARRSSPRTRWRLRPPPERCFSRVHEYTVVVHNHASVESVEKARLRACVARRTSRVYAQQDRVQVAVEADLHDLHRVAPGPALRPQAALSGETPCAPCLPRFVPRFLVHVSEHQHPARVRVLRDGGDEPLRKVGCHCLTSRPRAASSRLTSPIDVSPKWNIDAASAASAPPAVIASYMWRAVPAPPDAITGRRTASLTALVSSTSYPAWVPSLSMEVSRISPAPNLWPSAAHSTASRPEGRRPPWLNTSQPDKPSRLRASIASTTHCAPKTSAHRVMRFGSARAAVLTETLSAPCVSSSPMSCTLRTPPPTASGMNTSSAVRATASRRMRRASEEAVISRKTISSAPMRSYVAASCAGSPASRSSWKRTPLTTRT